MMNPRKILSRLLAGGVLTASLLAAGCGGDSGGLEPGCYSGDAVPAPVRENIETAAARLYDRVRTGNLQAVYEDAASLVRDQRTQDEFLQPIVRSVRSLGLPQDLEIERIHVLRFGSSFPYRKEVQCHAEGDEPTIFTVNDFPVQASLVQESRTGKERLYYSTLWNREEGVWRLAAFLVKLASIRGEGWEHYAEEAAAQKKKGNDRNAALLYNVAIDLLVANPWTKPPQVGKLQVEQRRISVSNLPVNQIDPWPAGADTFRVFHAGYTVDGGQLALMLRYQSPHAMQDSVEVKAYSQKLRNYVAAHFPEYPEVFPRLVLVASDPQDPKRVRINGFSLGPDR